MDKKKGKDDKKKDGRKPKRPPTNKGGPFNDPRVGHPLLPEDAMVECIYNKAHLVRKSNLEAHLIKCGRKHKTDLAKSQQAANRPRPIFDWARDVPRPNAEAYDFTRLRNVRRMERTVEDNSAEMHDPVTSDGVFSASFGRNEPRVAAVAATAETSRRRRRRRRVATNIYTNGANTNAGARANAGATLNGRATANARVAANARATATAGAATANTGAAADVGAIANAEAAEDEEDWGNIPPPGEEVYQPGYRPFFWTHPGLPGVVRRALRAEQQRIYELEQQARGIVVPPPQVEVVDAEVEVEIVQVIQVEAPPPIRRVPLVPYDFTNPDPPNPPDLDEFDIE